MADNKNYILAIVLSVGVLFAWQFFYVGPQVEAQREIERLQQEQQQRQQVEQGVVPDQLGEQDASVPTVSPQQPAGAATLPGAAGAVVERDQAIGSETRIAFENNSVSGSISLNGGRIDDLVLKDYRQTVDPASPRVVLLSPSSTQDGYFAEFGWVSGNPSLDLPRRGTEWALEEGEVLRPGAPVTLRYDSESGLIFRRTISLDENFMFTVQDSVENTTPNDVVLNPYALVARMSLPETESYFLFHEGFIGVFGERGLKEVNYDGVSDEPNRTISHTASDAWLGMTDKYWATVLIPGPEHQENLTGRFSSDISTTRTRYQADYLLPGMTLAAGMSAEATHLFFAGAKEVPVVNGYDSALNLNRFELLIDWGWLYFITKPMFQALKFFGDLTGNFGISILIVTLLIKVIFFPLSNKAYVSMSRMKKVQPEMEKLRDKHKDDKMKLQQGMMELYKREKINPLAGCLPILVQIPVFFALYKVLLVTIEMRHAPFFGWIQDLSAPDPTSIFNLFGLLPYDPPSFLILGVWPLLMGITMFIQMKLNPAPPDPTQRIIFDFMPLIFMVLLATFPAGLVIYWTWNNLLTILQQSFIMHRQGVAIDLWANIKTSFRYSKPKA